VSNPTPGDYPTPQSQGSPATNPIETISRLQQPLIDGEHLDAVIEQFSVLYPFPLDDFQRNAIRALLEGESVMVAAPTGSGKTVVAEFGIFDAFRRTGRVFYTAPIKALSNQKFRDLRKIYGNDVGLLTGDVSENRDARILVMTTEILRNMLLQTPWDLDDVECVIFDEIHYLADPDRGTTWEESIILCPDHIQLICLSATVTNAGEIAGWISRTHMPIRLITHEERPVPLALYYFHEDELSMVVDHTGRTVRDFSRVGGELRRQPGRPHRGRGAGRDARAMDEPQPREIIDALQEGGLLPAIYFLFSRNDCQAFAEQLAMMRPDLVNPSQQAQIDHVLETYHQSLRPEDRDLEQVRIISRLARIGIGFHHAGLLPILKQLVEVLFSRGLMQVVFATDTLALGVNMPARTVVIGRMSKWDGRRRRPLIPNEFQQMAGRAGRRGMDTFGHVVIPYSPWVPFREALDIATGPLHPVQSAFAIRYNTVLNLWDPPRGERVRQMLQRSLAQYQTSQRIRLIERDILDIESELAGLVGERQEEIAADDEAFEEYRSLDRQLQSARSERRKLDQEQTDLFVHASQGTPWTEPGRQAVRRVLKGAFAGAVFHLRDAGWAIFLSRPLNGEGIGHFILLDGRISTPSEYRAIDYVPDEITIPLPPELTSAEGSTLDLVGAISPELMAPIVAALNAEELPDLDALASEYREKQRVAIEARQATLDAALKANDELARTLQATKANHQFAESKARKRYASFLRRRDNLELERNSLAAILEREIEAEDIRIRNVIRGIRDVLHRFGYLRQGYPTEKADMLASIFDTDGLILCELVDRGILDPLIPGELAEMFSWFSFDRDFRYTNHFTLPDSLVNLRRALDELEHEVLGEERDHKLFISEGHNPSFYGAALAWSHGATMIQIGEQLELSEGDLVLTFNKTIDLMRQVREMVIDVLPDHPLATKLTLAERSLRRGIVEQSLTLGFAPIADAPSTAAEDEDDSLEDVLLPEDDDLTPGDDFE
jgi:ATP-dependent RNA helicase HelY